MARRMEMLEKQVAALHAEVKRLNANTVLKLNRAFDLQNVDGQPTAIFSGVNVQVVNGTGDQFTLNGRGNLTVGYTSPRTFGDPICSDGAFLTQSDCESNGKIWAILSFQYFRDVEGYSYDGTFLDDRKISRPSIRAEWGKKYFAEIAYTNFSDSPKYSLVVDRDNVVMFAGVNF